MNIHSLGGSHMLENWIEELKHAPSTLKTVPVRARKKARWVRQRSQTRLFTAQTPALQSVEQWLASTPDNIPVLSKVADVAEKATHQRLAEWTKVCLEDYSTLNAKTVIQSLEGLELGELLRIQHMEQTTKSRKTVLAAIDRALTSWLNAPVHTTAA